MDDTSATAGRPVDGERRLAARRRLAQMMLSREWDLRFELLLRSGRVSKWYSAVGNEALTVGAVEPLRDGDALLTLHRDVGALLARYAPIEELAPELFPGNAGRTKQGGATSRQYLHRLACQVMGRAEGFTQGFDRSYHFAQIEPSGGRGHVGMISHLGSMVPVAAGLAWALALKGRGGVALKFLGEGATSTGDFHEGLNLAAVWRLPLVLVIENNHYAFSTHEREQYACESLALRGAGYGIPGERVDGNDDEAVAATVARAVERARRGEGPTLIEGVVGRLRGHSEQDRSLAMVPAEELAAYRDADPLPRAEERLVGTGIVDEDWLARCRARVRELLVEITERAHRVPAPDPVEALARRSAFASPLVLSRSVEPPRGASVSTSTQSDERSGGGATYLEAIARALDEELARDDGVLLLGQDIARFGGAFGVTRGLLEKYGAQRVRNTPITESGAIGAAVGASLLGFRPVVEMQFADFISCGFNQLVNVAAKLHFRCEVAAPIVVRCPSGGGAAAGPFHSQCPEAWFAHTAGLKIYCPAFPVDALGLLKHAVRDPDPVLFFEHKYLYRRVREPLPEGDVVVAPGRCRRVRAGDDVSLITYGWMVHRALEAAGRLAAEGIDVEVVDLRTLVPLDEQGVLESVRKTAKVLIVHEAPRNCGFGAELAARIADLAFDDLDGPIRRLTYPDVPVPFHPDLEAACLPSVDGILAALRELAEY